MDDIPARDLVESDDPYENLRRNVARRDIPQAFALGGGFIIVMSVVSALTLDGEFIESVLVQLCTGLAMLFLGQVLGRGNFRAQTIMWWWAASSVMIVEIAIYVGVNTNSQTALAYSFVAMTAFAPVTLAWRPSLIAAAVMFVSFVVATVTVEGSHDEPLITSAFFAITVSFILLHLRLSGLDSISDEQVKAEAVASTDVLTGTLTRNGLLSLMPGLGGIAQRVGDHVCVMFLEVKNQGKAEEEYGVHYSDDVLRAVAHAIEDRVRTGDLVARWGGGSFVVVGLGDKPQADALGARIEDAVRIAGVNLGKWPTTVKVGTAAGDPQQTTFERLLADAAQEAGATPAASTVGKQ